MKSQYKRRMSKTLKEVMENALSEPATDQLSVLEELALARESIGPIIQIFDAARQSNKVEVEMQCGALMREALSEVVKIAESAARIANAGKDAPMQAVQVVVNQITRAACGVLGDDVAKAREMEEAIRVAVALPGLHTGTDLLPSDVTATVEDMDATIPALPSEEDIEEWRNE